MTIPGLLLGGRYRLLEPLGEGGMAMVHRARDELLDRDVAVKVLRDQYTADDDFVRRFRQEARNVAALAHPNVVAVFDSGVDGAVEYIVMQLVEGPDLEAVLGSRGRLSVPEALRIVITSAEALEAAHARGIVHRDIKPGNILLDAEGEVRVVDFGIARALAGARTTKPGMMLGSVQYCSPEQVLGEPVGPASDIYSLGIVLYELLTGHRPWDGPSMAAVALARLHEVPPPPSELAPDLPASLDRLVLRALQRDPRRRYPSARAMAQAIRDWWRTEPGVGASDPRRTTTRRRGLATARVPLASAIATVAGAGHRGGDALRSADGSAPGYFGDAAGETDTRTQVHHASRGGPRESRHRQGAWVLPGLAVLMLAGASLAIASRANSPGGEALDVTGPPRTSAASVLPPATSTAASTPSLAPTASPTPTPTPTPLTPTSSPTPPPTPPPTPTPPPPTPAPTPPTAVPPTPAPTPAAPAATPASPAVTTAQFYTLVVEDRFDAAAKLWTAEMRRRYPPDEYIAGRFAPTTRIDLNRNDVVALDERAGRAVVAVDLTEYRENRTIRRFVGSWDLVRTDAGWRMNDPDF